MKITRLFTGEDGQSHFLDEELATTASPYGKLTSPIEAEKIFFGQFEANDTAEIPWHNPPCAQFVIMLEGAMEIELGSGERRVFHPGDILIAEDTTGQGHQTRLASQGRRRYLVVPIK